MVIAAEVWSEAVLATSKGTSGVVVPIPTFPPASNLPLKYPSLKRCEASPKSIKPSRAAFDVTFHGIISSLLWLINKPASPEPIVIVSPPRVPISPTPVLSLLKYTIAPSDVLRVKAAAFVPSDTRAMMANIGGAEFAKMVRGRIAKTFGYLSGSLAITGATAFLLFTRGIYHFIFLSLPCTSIQLYNQTSLYTVINCVGWML